MDGLLGNYAPYILGAMGSAVFFMLLEPLLLMMKRRSVLQEVKRVRRLDKRRERDTQSIR